MGIMKKRNAVLGWAVWKVGKRVVKRKAKAAVPGTGGGGGGGGGRAKAALATVAVSRLKRYETGFAEASPGGHVTRFLEKPVLGTPMAECLGIYVFETGIFRYLAEARAKKKNVNLSFDILSRLPAAGRVYAYEMGERPWLDVESASTVERNTDLVRKILDEMQVK